MMSRVTNYTGLESPPLVMPEGRKIRKRSDYIFRLSGISRIKRTVTNRRETPAQQNAGVTGWRDRGSDTGAGDGGAGDAGDGVA